MIDQSRGLVKGARGQDSLLFVQYFSLGLTNDNFPEVKQIYKKSTPFEWSFSKLKFTIKDAKCCLGIRNTHKQRKFDLRTKEEQRNVK